MMEVPAATLLKQPNSPRRTRTCVRDFYRTCSSWVFHLLGKDEETLNLSGFGLFPKSYSSTSQQGEKGKKGKREKVPLPNAAESRVSSLVTWATPTFGWHRWIRL